MRRALSVTTFPFEPSYTVSKVAGGKRNGVKSAIHGQIDTPLRPRTRTQKHSLSRRRPAPFETHFICTASPAIRRRRHVISPMLMTMDDDKVPGRATGTRRHANGSSCEDTAQCAGICSGVGSAAQIASPRGLCHRSNRASDYTSEVCFI